MGVATISRLLEIIRLFCRIPSLVCGSFAKETYDFKEPPNRSHPIPSLILFQKKVKSLVALEKSQESYPRVWDGYD